MGVEHKDFANVRDYVQATVNKVGSPVAEAELEEIIRCALVGGYKFNLTNLLQAHGAFTLGYSYNSNGKLEKI